MDAAIENSNYNWEEKKTILSFFVCNSFESRDFVLPKVIEQLIISYTIRDNDIYTDRQKRQFVKHFLSKAIYLETQQLCNDLKKILCNCNLITDEWLHQTLSTNILRKFGVIHKIGKHCASKNMLHMDTNVDMIVDDDNDEQDFVDGYDMCIICCLGTKVDENTCINPITDIIYTIDPIKQTIIRIQPKKDYILTNEINLKYLQLHRLRQLVQLQLNDYLTIYYKNSNYGKNNNSNGDGKQLCKGTGFVFLFDDDDDNDNRNNDNPSNDNSATECDVNDNLYSGTNNRSMRIIISYILDNDSCYCNGTWRSNFGISFAQSKKIDDNHDNDNDGNINNIRTIIVNGTIDINTHWFEDGNVKLQCNLKDQKEIEIDISDDSKTAVNIIDAIKEMENNTWQRLNKYFVQAHDQMFKAICRKYRLWIPKRFDWRWEVHQKVNQVISRSGWH